MSTIGARILHLRESHNLTQKEFAEMLNVTDKAVSTWENDTKVPRMGTIQKIADKFHTTKSYIVDGVQPNDPRVGEPYHPTHRIPILGSISAGLPLFAEENLEGYTYTDLNGGSEYFALRVRGDSMTALRMYEGDLLIVRKQDTVDNDEIAVVLVDGDSATVKRFFRSGSTVTLYPQSLNPAHKPQVYDLRYTDIRILGKVVRNQIDY